MSLGKNSLQRVNGFGLTASIISTPPNVKVINDSTNTAAHTVRFEIGISRCMSTRRN